MFKKIITLLFSIFLVNSFANETDNFCFKNELNDHADECFDLKERFEFFIDTYYKKYESDELDNKFKIFKENYIRVINDKSYLTMTEEDISRLDQIVKTEL
jgi:hypothetical protein